VSLASFAVLDYFLKFLFKKFIALGKIYVFVNVWKKEK
jgi:hypothetical protein